MPNWIQFNDPLVRWVVLGSIGVILLILLARARQRWRDSAYARQRRLDHQKRVALQRHDDEQSARLACKILATSSTSQIAGFEISRQIEAVFVEGRPTPADAVDQLKARAARLGGNAIVNLQAVRLPNGKCVANGDAVIVKPLT